MKRFNPVLLYVFNDYLLDKRKLKIIKFFKNKKGYECCYNMYTGQHFIYKTRLYYYEDKEIFDMVRARNGRYKL